MLTLRVLVAAVGVAAGLLGAAFEAAAGVLSWESALDSSPIYVVTLGLPFFVLAGTTSVLGRRGTYATLSILAPVSLAWAAWIATADGPLSRVGLVFVAPYFAGIPFVALAVDKALKVARSLDGAPPPA